MSDAVLPDFYRALGVRPEASSAEIQAAAEARARGMTPARVLAAVAELHPSDTAAATEARARKIFVQGRRYFADVCRLLLDASARGVYDRLRQTKGVMSEEERAVVHRQLVWLGRHGPTRAPSSVLGLVAPAEPIRVSDGLERAAPDATRGFLCRSCRRPMRTLHTLQCACDTRVFHEACMETFAQRYHGQCPVCRTRLVPIRFSMSAFHVPSKRHYR